MLSSRGMPSRRESVALAVLVLLCLAVGALGGAVTQTSVGTWYQGLEKPFFTPPDWLFAPVWTLLYVLMAVAAWRVWRTYGDAPSRRNALRLFAAQLALNLAWSFLFFGARSPSFALADIVVLEIVILLCMRSFARLDRGAALLLLPYAAWVAYAAVLNGAIVLLN